MFENGKEAVAYLVDIDDKIPSTAVAGNLAAFGANQNLVDSGTKPSDFITPSAVDSKISAQTSKLSEAQIDAYAIAAYKASDWQTGTYYERGSFCKHAGSGYRCIESHSSTATFDSSKWERVLTPAGASAIDAMLSACSNAGMASLLNLAPAYDESTSVRYEVGQLVVDNGVLKICTRAGNGYHARFSDDATVEKAIEQRISQALVDNGVPYKIVEIVQEETDDPTHATFNLVDHAINVVTATIAANVDVVLIPPDPIDTNGGSDVARDFSVVLTITSDEEIPVDLDGTSLRDYAGDPVDLAAVSGQSVVYRFTEIADAGNFFLVTGLADPAYRGVKEIERALDEILEGSAVTPDIRTGIYIEDENNPNVLHKIVAWTDPETQEVVVKVIQDPVERV